MHKWEESMSIQLLDKTRKITKVLHNNNSNKLNFGEIARVLSEILESSVMVFSKKGKLLGTGIREEIPVIGEFKELKVGECIDKIFNERFLNILSTKENVNLKTLGLEQLEEGRYEAIINPIDVAGERLGTLFIYKINEEYEIDDIILSEYGTTVVGLEMLRSIHEENEDAQRNEKMLQAALHTLSYSELQAIENVLKELDHYEGIVIASKIADKIGITRSVIVNALRKLESAGVIASHSSGMKGTYIKVLNRGLYERVQQRMEMLGMQDISNNLSF